MKEIRQRSNSKYGLTNMQVGQKKLFKYEDHSKLRLACHFTSKRYDRLYTTRVIKGKTVKRIEIERVK